jgi:hypothetical protein
MKPQVSRPLRSGRDATRRCTATKYSSTTGSRPISGMRCFTPNGLSTLPSTEWVRRPIAGLAIQPQRAPAVRASCGRRRERTDPCERAGGAWASARMGRLAERPAGSARDRTRGASPRCTLRAERRAVVTPLVERTTLRESRPYGRLTLLTRVARGPYGRDPEWPACGCGRARVRLHA